MWWGGNMEMHWLCGGGMIWYDVVWCGSVEWYGVVVCGVE